MGGFGKRMPKKVAALVCHRQTGARQDTGCGLGTASVAEWDRNHGLESGLVGGGGAGVAGVFAARRNVIAKSSRNAAMSRTGTSLALHR